MNASVGQEKNYLYSQGTGAIIEKLQEAIDNNLPKPYLFDALFVNVFTILRNCYNKDIRSVPQLTEAAKSDVLELASVASTYQSKYSEKQLPIILYYPKYNSIPVIHRRTPPKSMELLWAAYTDYVLAHNNDATTHISELVDILEIPVGGHGQPMVYKELAKVAQKLSSKYGGFRNILMVSHIALDWHMYRYCSFLDNKGFHLFESYTAKLTAPVQFGMKAFKTEYMPFIPYSHFVMGDPVLIQPIVQRKARKELIEQAHEGRWSWSSPEVIRNKLKSMYPLSPQLTL